MIILADGTKILKSQISKFSNLEIAKRYAARLKYIVFPLMGDDGKYWVADNTRLESKLVKEGFERAVC